jgi:hypothetical protein|tara:strand:+ start:395 stop:763 length:369 start_codon:yes stop_codon:yes gene_type:complete
MSITIGKDQFVEKIKKWVLLDSQLKAINEKTKTIREEKNALNQEVCHFLETNQMKHKKIGIHDGELKMHEKKEYSPLSFTFLEEHLGKIVSDENQLHAILAYLKENREIKVSNELKRTYKTK